MAEVAGTVIGILSLSVQICQGLVWYINGVKNGQSKAERIKAEMEALANLLEVLESVVGKTVQTGSTESTRVGISTCAQAIEAIRKKLRDRGPPSGSRLRIGLAEMVGRLSTPFKEPEIRYWKDIIDCTQQQLQLALHSLQLDCQIQHRLDHESMQQETRDLQLSVQISKQLILRDQEKNQKSTMLRLEEQTQLIRSSSSVTERHLDSLRERLSDVQKTVQSASQDTSHLATLPHILSSISRMESKLDTIAVVPRTTPTLQTDFNDIITLSRAVWGSYPNFKNRRREQMHCTCSKRSEKTTYIRWPFHMSHTRTSHHDRCCPYAVCDEPDKEFTVQLPVLCLLFRRKLNLYVALSRATGSLGIKPGLAVHKVVDRSSPAFALVTSLFTFNVPLLRIQTTWQKLSYMFETRQASPFDRLADGQTLLHHFCETMSSEFWTLDTQNLDGYRALLSHILITVKDSALETDDSGYTCADLLLRGVYSSNAKCKSLVILLLEHDVKISPMAEKLRGRHYPAYGSWIEISFEAFPDPFVHYDEASELIFYRSEKRLRKILREPRIGRKGSTSGMGLYKLATRKGWVEGCRILTEFVELVPNDWEENYRHPLLFDAIESGNPEMAQFWLLFRESANEECLPFIGDLETAYRYAGQHNRWRSFATVILCHMVKQRDCIKKLAEQNGVSLCTMEEGVVLDSHTSCILDALLEKGCEVPDCWRPRYSSVYLARSSASIALVYERKTDQTWTLQALFDAGFKDIADEESGCLRKRCCPPLVNAIMSHSYYASNGYSLADLFEPIDWFISNGASLDRCWPDTKWTAMHFLATKLAQYSWHIPPSLPHMLQSTSAIFECKFIDDCSCACNISGCTTFTSFWKGASLEDICILSSTQSDIWWSETCSQETVGASNMRIHTRKILANSFRLVTGAIRAETHRSVITEFIRLYVFSLLGIRHRCCNLKGFHNGGPVSLYVPGETETIIQEDQFLVDLLEELVPKLDAAFDEFNGNLQSFVDKKLEPDMIEVLEQLKLEDQEMYGEGRRDIGVVMDD